MSLPDTYQVREFIHDAFTSLEQVLGHLDDFDEETL